MNTPRYRANRTGEVGRGAGRGEWRSGFEAGHGVPGSARILTWLVGLMLAMGAGCGSGPEAFVVVYAAQDRVYAEPLFREFERATGIRVRAVYDNEATKTTGLANRVLAERSNPQADLWWSNEEMRTRQLVAAGVLERDFGVFGERRRVLVCVSNRLEAVGSTGTLAVLTNVAWRGRVAVAYPLFGTTAAHLLVLRQRWGVTAWRRWCEGLRTNRVLVVDGNSTVVRMVTAGDAWLGLTDTDDAEAARREGAPLAVVALRAEDDLTIPNTVALVRGSRRETAARRLAEYLRSPAVVDRLVAVGALASGKEGGTRAETEPTWDRVLAELDSGLEEMETVFRR